MASADKCSPGSLGWKPTSALLAPRTSSPTARPGLAARTGGMTAFPQGSHQSWGVGRMKAGRALHVPYAGPGYGDLGGLTLWQVAGTVCLHPGFGRMSGYDPGCRGTGEQEGWGVEVYWHWLCSVISMSWFYIPSQIIEHIRSAHRCLEGWGMRQLLCIFMVKSKGTDRMTNCQLADPIYILSLLLPELSQLGWRK